MVWLLFAAGVVLPSQFRLRHKVKDIPWIPVAVAVAGVVCCLKKKEELKEEITSSKRLLSSLATCNSCMTAATQQECLLISDSATQQ